MADLPQSDPTRRDAGGFLPEVLDRTVISIPLLRELKREEAELREDPRTQTALYPVVIDLNLEYFGGRSAARGWVVDVLEQLIEKSGRAGHQINRPKTDLSEQYVFARLDGQVIRELVRRDSQPRQGDRALPPATIAQRAIYRIWPDFPIKALLNKSISTVKADAARISFSAFGDNIVWAVLDSGIDGTHPHFKMHRNLELDEPLGHLDFTGGDCPLVDAYGHGTHVAGIIGGELVASLDGSAEHAIRAVARYRDEDGEARHEMLQLGTISGMAPRCKLLSLKVLDDSGDGLASNLIAAIEHIQRINGYGRRLRIHGVNMSVGYDFEPEWFACGQSPLCVEVDRLVRSGVVVVVAAGNTGYGYQQTTFRGAVAAGLGVTVNDPGNAELAITVGSTHRDMPHVYGVSYFSSKGPTGDGRLKPDLVAPGEKILSCAAGEAKKRVEDFDYDYVEDSGTSMAAPHVSGVIAAFLSVRREFSGQPEAVKRIFVSTATDLKRDRNFQGYGLVDLMRAIQSV